MSDKYKTVSTSKSSATVNDIELSSSTTTRKIVRPELVNNPNDSEAGVKITLLHQRKKTGDVWEDLDSKPLSEMKAGETVKLSLRSAETLKLFSELQKLFAISKAKGVPNGTKNIVVGLESEIIKTDPQRARVISELLKHGHSEEFWKELVVNQPELATKFSILRLHQRRQKAFQEFEQGLAGDKDEAFWQNFFEKNTWIFGYGLNYKFLKTVQAQPYYGSTNVTGKGGQRGDFLSASAAEVRFTVLVEVKKSSTLLLGNEYRNGAFPCSSELAGGVSQLQANCRKWEVEGSRTEENRDKLQNLDILSIQPKGILIIGHTSQLKSTPMRSSFEMFRRNLVNPEVITFDELLERARYILEHPKDDKT